MATAKRRNPNHVGQHRAEDKTPATPATPPDPRTAQERSAIGDAMASTPRTLDYFHPHA